MKYRVQLLFTVLALCLGCVISKGLSEQKIFSANIEVIRPISDCLEQLGDNNNNNNNNTRKCEIDLFSPESLKVENIQNLRYVMNIEIGSDKQKFKVLIDTGSSLLWVYGAECKDTSPPCQGHRKLKSADSDTYEKINEAFQIRYGMGSVKGITAKDTVHLSETLKAVGQKFGTASSASMQFRNMDGVLGLNMRQGLGDSPAITAMKAAGMAPVFSLFLRGGGSAVDGGEITFGGVNEARFKKDRKLEVPVIGKGKFILQMDAVTFGDREVCTKGGEVYCKVLIDSGSSMILGPKALIDGFNKHVLKGKGGLMKRVECDKIPSFPDINIRFGKSTLTLESKYYIGVFAPDRCYSYLRGVDDAGKKWTFGDPFLVKFYTVYNIKPDSPSITFYDAK